MGRKLSPKPLATGVCLVAATALGGNFVVAAADDVAMSSSLTTADAEVFAGIDPVRLLDTRNGVGAPAPGQFGPGELRTLVIAGANGIPADATSVALNVTIPRSASTTSFVTVWPTGTPQPATSTNNATPGQAVPNFTITSLGTGGAIQVFNERGNTDIVIDIVGYYVALDSVDGMGGAPGSGSSTNILNGAGAPAFSLGNDGDFYIDTTNNVLYGPKTVTGWGPGVSLVGPAGPAGADGSTVDVGDGAPGADGDDSIGDIYIDQSTGDIYRFDGTTWVLVGSTAPPRAGGSVADSAAALPVPELSVLDLPGNDVQVGSLTGLPAGTYDASATVDLAIDATGVLGIGAGIQARCWWDTNPAVKFTTSLTAAIDLSLSLDFVIPLPVPLPIDLGEILDLELPGVATGSVTVPGTIDGTSANLICDAGATAALLAEIDVRSVDMSAVRTGADIGTVTL
ncbi:MAG: hypothetical protein ABJH68_05510 [Ilumatobacter sp.]|uniref:hypothetical protein n=1 Tax=Ilumatobacter sp. TaxID=1967498 RepID=UPI003297F6D2